MALDAALMESVRGGAAPVLRFYRWAPACLSLGRNQPAAGCYRTEALEAAGVEVVRRPTGGRAVLHDHELTYSVAVGVGVLGSPRESYAAVNRALVAGLRRLGVDAALQPRRAGRAPVPSLAPCFREPAEGEVVAGGGKLVGSAQYREGGAILQHGSLLLSGDQRRVASFLREPGPPEPEAPAALDRFLDPLPGWEALTRALAAGWEEAIGPLEPVAAPVEAETARAVALQERYASPAWTWRR
jgi:lipoate-protein ligase A